MIEVTSSRGRASAQFQVDGDMAEVSARVRSVVDGERRFIWRYAVGSTIVISTRLNWATWGELMTLELTSAGASNTWIDARVAPIVPTTRADWGQGSRDIRRLHDLLVAATPATAESQDGPAGGSWTPKGSAR